MPTVVEALPMLRRVARSMSRLYPHYSPTDFEELCYVELFRVIERYQPEHGNFQSYVSRCVWGLMMTDVRREARRFEIMLSVRRVGEESYEMDESVSDLKYALADLKPRELDLLLRVYGLDYEAKEAGEVWGVSKSRASRLVRAARDVVHERLVA